MNARTTLTLALLLVSVAAVAQTPPEKPPYLGPREIIQLLEASANSYAIAPGSRGKGELADPYAVLFPEKYEPIDPVRVVVVDGRRMLEPYPMSEQMVGVMVEAQKHFAASDAHGARAQYDRAIALDSTFYLPYNYFGDTYMMERDAEGALPHYRRAVELNPDHYQPHYNYGAALYYLGRFDEARTELVRALVLNPRHENTYMLLRGWGEDLGVRLVDTLLTPGGIAVRDGRSVKIVYDTAAGAGWLIYAMAKGMWLGEPDHRRAMLGGDREGWSSIEERECLGALLAAYVGRDRTKEPADPQLDRLVAIVDEGFIDEFILYEIATRINPQTTLVVPDELRRSLEEFVGRFVLGVGNEK